jgi:hypothetical protein
MVVSGISPARTEDTMTELKHTPGPWYCIPGEFDYVREEFTDACIARVFEDNGHADERGREDLPQEANARLISAAPDLIEACEIWIQHYDKYVRDKNIGDEIGIAEMRAAIAKAKGES